MQKKTRVRGQMRPLTFREVQTIQSRMYTRKDWRNLCLFRLGIDSMLRASDLVRICLDEVLDHNNAVMSRSEVFVKKTGKPVKISISSETKIAVAKWVEVRPAFAGEWLFPGREPGSHLSEIQYRRLTKEWFGLAGLDVRYYSTHSLRRTKPAEIYRRTHNIEAISRLLGHSDIKMTSLYLGIQDEDALDLADKVKI
jgi:integrase